MAVILRKMTQNAFKAFYQWSIAHHAVELMDELHTSRDEAINKAIAEVGEMLPDGLHTKDHCLSSIIDTETTETVGFIWTLQEETDGRKQSFLCDFAIWEPARRKGYGQEALCLAEKNAVEAGCQESVLFVSDKNTAARALHDKCGYHVLRKEGHGKYMIKKLQ